MQVVSVLGIATLQDVLVFRVWRLLRHIFVTLDYVARLQCPKAEASLGGKSLTGSTGTDSRPAR